MISLESHRPKRKPSTPKKLQTIQVTNEHMEIKSKKRKLKDFEFDKKKYNEDYHMEQ